MPPGGTGRAPTRIAIAACLAVVLTALGTVPATGGPGHAIAGPRPTSGPSAASLPSAGPSWDNGVVRLTFSHPDPTFTVASDRDARVAASGALTAIAEVNPKGNVTAIAHLPGRNVSWGFYSTATPGATAVSAGAWVPVVGSHGGWQSDDGFPDDRGSGGRAHVVVTFYLNASNAAAPNVVRFTVNVSAWPWSNASDHLGLAMNSTAANSTRLVAGAGPNQILEVRNGSANTTVAALSWDSEASVAYNGSMSNTSSVGTFEALGVNGSNSSIRLSFGAVSGGYSELSYDPLVQLNLSAFQPRTLAPPILLQGHWLPAWELAQSTLEVTAAGILVVSLLGIAAWRNRARPEPPP